MSAASNLDADAFMRQYLKCPTDTTARLVFADWLEESGEPPSAAWAHYIRLKAAADRHPHDSATRYEVDRHAGQYAVHVRARLTVPAKLFVGYPKSLLQLLPAQNLTVKIGKFAVPDDVLELIPESVARENLILPLAAQDKALLVAGADPNDADLVEKLDLILNRNVLLIGAERADLHRAIDREFGRLGSSHGSAAWEYAPQPGRPNDTENPEFEPDASAVWFVNRIFREAIDLRADRIHLFPEPTGTVFRFRIGAEWVLGGFVPTRYVPQTLARLANMAGIPVEWTSAKPLSSEPITGAFPIRANGTHFRVRVTLQPAPDGPTAQIDLVGEPSPIEL